MKRKSSFYEAMTGSTPTLANESQDCVVRSFALASGREYDEVHAALKTHGREDRKPTRDATIFAAAADLDAQIIDYRSAGFKPTLASFLREHPRGCFVVIRSGHAFTVINGMVHDWKHSDTGPRSRVRYAFELLPDA